MDVTISSYSLITTVVIYNLALVLIYFLRKSNLFLIRYGAGVLLFITMLSVIRLLSPVDFLHAYVVQSETLVPAVKSVLKLHPFSSTVNLTVGHFVLLAWLTGACYFALKYIFSVHEAMRLRKSYVLTCNKQVDLVVKELDVKTPVLVSAQVKLSHTAGFFRPIIYLPDLDLSAEAWEYILRHEVQHIKAHDVWIKFFYAVLEAVMWWNPVSHLFMRELDAMLELRCDAALVARQSENERLEYLETILQVLKSVPPDSSEAISACFAKREQYISERFDAVLNPGKRANMRARCSVIVLSLMVFFLSYFVVIQPAYSAPLESWMETGVKNKIDEQFILFDGENYYLYVENALYKNLTDMEVTEEQYNLLPIYGEDIK